MMLIPRRDFDLFDDFFRDDFFKGKEKLSLMRTDIKETENSFILDIDLPGYNKGDIKIDVTNGYLNINAKTERNNDGKDKYIRHERFIGECSRSFYIGDDVNVENIKASFRNGILSLEVPKVDSFIKDSDKRYIEIID